MLIPHRNLYAEGIQYLPAKVCDHQELGKTRAGRRQAAYFKNI